MKEEPYFEGADPLSASLPLPHERLLFPYGFPALIRSNCVGVLGAAERSWVGYSRLVDVDPVEVRILVSESKAVGSLVIPSFRAQSNLFTLVSDCQNHGCCDLTSGIGFACVSNAAVHDEEYFRYHFLEAMIYTLLEGRHLATVHAACVVHNNRGVLLAGKPGAGKSSLAYACALRGWTYVSDDASSLLPDCECPIVTGYPFSFRFRPCADALFPELKAKINARNGMPTVEVRTEDLQRLKVTPQCEVGFLIFLNRQDSYVIPELTPVSEEDSFRRLFKNPWPADLPMQQRRAAAIRLLTACPAHKLTYRDQDPAIDILEKLIAQSSTRLNGPGQVLLDLR